MATIDHLKEIAPFIQPESMAVGCSKRRDHFWDLLIAELEAWRKLHDLERGSFPLSGSTKEERLLLIETIDKARKARKAVDDA